MKIIDAMAVGLPVMMPAFGGPMEYAPSGGFLPLDFEEVPVGACYDTDHYLVGPGAYWCQVREESLVDALRSYLDDPTASDRAAAVARSHVFGRYTWRNAASSLVSALERWHAEVDGTVRHRRRPATVPLSVIMPTKDRPAELAKTLAGYAAQDDKAFELLVVNDHGDGESVRRVVSTFSSGLRVRVIDNDGPPGPGAARNRGLEQAEGEIMLVTGDDIIPASDLVARHRDAHRRHPGVEDAFVGAVDWHREMNAEWFVHHIVGDGGQQFDFRGLRDDQNVPFDRFFTANVSWKRRLTADLEHIFSESFRWAAYEDVELGYRLSQRGMKLRYLEHAKGYHLHPMTARGFFERMRRVGSMRTVLATMHPALVGDQGLLLYQDLEVERRRRDSREPGGSGPSWEGILEPLVAAFDRLDAWAASDRPLSGAAADHVGDLEGRVLAVRRRLFDDLCVAFMQVGQAQEWARGTPEEGWAPAWVATLRLSQHGAGPVNEGPASGRHWLLKRLRFRFGFARRVREYLRQARRWRRARK